MGKETQTTNYYNTRILTWGSDYEASQKRHAIEAQLFGGNVGHAAVEIYFPADKRGKELIDKYCNLELPYYIPHQIVTKKHKIIDYKRDKKGRIIFNKNGQPIEHIYESIKRYYKVYFSWWPGADGDFGMSTYEEDCRDERRGVHFEWSDAAKAMMGGHVDTRMSRGLFNSRSITLHSYLRTNISNDVSDEIMQLLQKYKEYALKIKILQNDVYKYKKTIEKTISFFEKKKNTIKVEHLTSIDVDNMKCDEKLKRKIKKFLQLYDEGNRKIEEAEKDLDVITRKLIGEEIDISDFIHYGLQPEVTTVPTIDSTVKEGEGLDVENMLQAMNKIVADKKGFNLYGKNCSATTMSILRAGVRERDKHILTSSIAEVDDEYKDKRSFFIRMLTPQQVFDAATRIKDKLMGKESAHTDILDKQQHKSYSWSSVLHSVAKKIKRKFNDIKDSFRDDLKNVVKMLGKQKQCILTGNLKKAEEYKRRILKALERIPKKQADKRFTYKIGNQKVSTTLMEAAILNSCNQTVIYLVARRNVDLENKFNYKIQQDNGDQINKEMNYVELAESIITGYEKGYNNPTKITENAFRIKNYLENELAHNRKLINEELPGLAYDKSSLKGGKLQTKSGKAILNEFSQSEKHSSNTQRLHGHNDTKFHER